MARQIAVKCIENNLAPCDGSMLDADGVLLRSAFFWYTTRWDQGQQYFYLYQTGCTLPL